VKGLEKEYKREGLKVVWIGFQDKESKIREFMQRHGIESNVGYDNGDAVSRAYGIKYGAGLVFINREGIVVKKVPKGFSQDVLKRATDSLLSEERKDR
jgi:peroxiredoxin